MDKYYALEKTEKEADVTIFGDITSFPWKESDMSAHILSKQIAELDVDRINVHISSYGGEVKEGLAIYNALKQHKAKIRTVCDGFACSIASVIFMAGDDRIMNDASLLMIHNPWVNTSGNAKELRKTAEDLDKMQATSLAAYMACVEITEEEVKELLDKESFLTPQEALDYGFATEIAGKKAKAKYSQSVRERLAGMILAQQAAEQAGSEPQPQPELEPQPEPPKEKNIMSLFKGIARKEG